MLVSREHLMTPPPTHPFISSSDWEFNNPVYDRDPQWLSQPWRTRMMRLVRRLDGLRCTWLIANFHIKRNLLDSELPGFSDTAEAQTTTVSISVVDVWGSWSWLNRSHVFHHDCVHKDSQDFLLFIHMEFYPQDSFHMCWLDLACNSVC